MKAGRLLEEPLRDPSKSVRPVGVVAVQVPVDLARRPGAQRKQTWSQRPRVNPNPKTPISKKKSTTKKKSTKMMMKMTTTMKTTNRPNSF